MPQKNLQDIINGDLRPLHNALSLSGKDDSISLPQLRMKLAKKLFDRLFTVNTLDTTFTAQLHELKANFITYSGQTDIFYSTASHPLRQLVSWLINDASHWCPRTSKNSQEFYQKISETLALGIAACAKDAAMVELQNALAQLPAWRESENKRALMLEKRLCETEAITIRMITAERRVLELINNSLAGQPLPEELHTHFRDTLKSELQHCIFAADQTGTGSTTAPWKELPFWKCWQRLLPYIGNIFPQADTEVDAQQLYRQIPAILAELERSLQIHTSNPLGYAQMVNKLSHYLMLTIQQQAVACELFVPIPYPKAANETNTRVVQLLLQRCEEIQLNDWVLFSGEDNQLIRCKLALKNLSADQYLFVDYSGRKVMLKNTNDLALCISTGIIQPLKRPSIEAVIAEFLASLLARAEQLHAQHVDHQKLKAEQAALARAKQDQLAAQQAHQQQQEQQRRMEEQLSARRIAARKAMSEARALGEDKIKRAKAQQLADELAQAQLQKMRTEAIAANQIKAMTTVAELNVGAWLALSLSDQSEPIRGKLSVIIGSIGKYIFADQLGRKLIEFSRDQLVQLIAEDRAHIIHKGDNFEDQLAKVIRGLRKDISS